jgi:sugar transferase (PEP-CTERM system associated)
MTDLTAQLVRGRSPKVVLVALDVALTALFWSAAAFVLAQLQPPAIRPPALALLVYPLLFGMFLYALGLYRRDALVERRRAIARVPFAAGLAALVGSLTALLPPPLHNPSALACFAAALAALTAAGALSRLVFAALRRGAAFRCRLLVVGAGARAWDLLWLMQKEGRRVQYEVILLHDPALGALDPRLAEDKEVRIVEASGDYLAAARAEDVEQIVVAPDERRGLPMPALLRCRTAGFPVNEYARFVEREIGRIDLKRLDLASLLYTDGFTLGLLDRALKRGLDVAASLAVLTLTLPFLLAAMLAVRLEDGGPALYRQARVTQGGRVFHILKLRTMRVDAERAGAQWAAERDPRITRIGLFLRRTRLDELPQLFNILRGDMSFVGPRPERPEFTADLSAKLPLYDERHLVKAGLTGWAQINYPYGASLDDARSKLSYDLYYVKNFSLFFDVVIILQTLRAVLFPASAGAR